MMSASPHFRPPKNRPLGRLRRRAARVAATLLLLAVALPLAGCATSDADGGLGLDEDVKVRDLAGPKRYTTLEDLQPDGNATTMALPESLATPTVGVGEFTGGTQRVQKPVPEHLTEEGQEAAEAAWQAERAALPLDLRSDADAEAAADADGDAESELDNDQPAQPPRHREAADEDERLPRRVTVRRLIFQHPQPRLARALDMIDETALADAEQQAWRESGFRVGQIDRDRLPLFMANLPRTLSVDMFTLHRVNQYAPIPLIDRLRGAHLVDVATATNLSDRHRLIGGRFQMLLKLVPDLEREDRRLLLDLLPHHRDIQAELVPRSPAERALDGTSFNELRLYEPLSTRRIWVVAADLPLEPPEQDQDEDQDQDQAEAGDDAPAPQRPRRPTQLEPVKLGHAMMQGLYRQRQVQMVLLIVAD